MLAGPYYEPADGVIHPRARLCGLCMEPDAPMVTLVVRALRRCSPRACARCDLKEVGMTASEDRNQPPAGRVLCAGVRVDATSCQAIRRGDSSFCWSHDPATAGEREAAKAAAVARREERERRNAPRRWP